MLIIKNDSLSGLISSSLETGSTSGSTSSVTLDVSLKEHQDTIIWNFSDQTISVPAQMGYTQTELTALSALYENEVISLSAFAAFDDLRFIGSAGNDYVVIDGLSSSFTVEQFDQARPGVSFGSDIYKGDSHYLTVKLGDYNSGSDLNAEIANGGINLTTTLGSISAENVDRLDGSDLANLLTGDVGNNVMNSGAGQDIINGGVGNDTLNGGAGNDVLTGGIGSDSFQFLGDFGSDVITDFSVSDDSLAFFDESGIEVASSALTESTNIDGDLVLTASNGSNVTLAGVSSLGVSSTDLKGSVVSRTGTVLEGASVKSLDKAGKEVGATTTDSSGNFGLSVSDDVTLSITQDFTNNRTVTVIDALDALKLALGMSKGDGTKHAYDFIAADINKDGKVSVMDALDILKYALKMDVSPAHWFFAPDDLDVSAVTRKSVSYDNEIAISYADAAQDHNLIGILVGDVNGTF